MERDGKCVHKELDETISYIKMDKTLVFKIKDYCLNQPPIQSTKNVKSSNLCEQRMRKNAKTKAFPQAFFVTKYCKKLLNQIMDIIVLSMSILIAY